MNTDNIFLRNSPKKSSIVRRFVPVPSKQMQLAVNKIYILIQMHRIVIFFVSLTLTLTLHTHHSIDHLLTRPILHMQNTVKEPAFEAGFADMKALVDNINKVLTSKDANKYQFLITKTTEIQAGLNKLQSTLQSYNLSVTNSSKVCPGVTTFNRSELRRYITYTEQKVTASIEYLSTCVECSFISNDFVKIQNLTNSFIENLNKTLDGAYCNKERTKSEKPTGYVNLNTSYYKNNLKAKNWYYGSTTASDYKIYIFKRSASYNLTNCPLSTPFVNDNQQICFNCPEGSIFNLGDQKCDTCKVNQILNIKSGKCDKCLGQKKFVNETLVCKLCILAEGQLFNSTSGKCYTCKNDSYLDTEKLACIKIQCDPKTPRFNRATHQCQACGVSEIIDPKDVTKCIKTNFVALCPPATPLYDENSKGCVACPSKTIYNKQNNRCEPPSTMSHAATQNNISSTVIYSCSSEKPKFNTILGVCQACPEGYIFYKDSAQCEKDIKCGPTQTVDRKTSTCIETSTTCRENEVYILKINRCLSKSITCNQHQYYSPELHSCITFQSNCGIDEYYDQKDHQCVPKEKKCKYNQNYNKELHVCQEMILCKSDEQLNYQLRICEKKKLKCNQETEYFSQYSLKCEPFTFITSPFTSNLIIMDDYKQYVDKYNNQKRSFANLKDCPFKTPFYSSLSKICISCPTQTPYFDVKSQKCVECTQKKVYNPSSHACQLINLTSVSNTIERINV